MHPPKNLNQRAILKTQKPDSNKVNSLKFLNWNYNDLVESENSIFYDQEAIKIAFY